MDKNVILELISCPLMSQITINTKTSLWRNTFCLTKALKGRTSVKYVAMNGFDWEESHQGMSYWSKFDDGDVPRLTHWK